jgi:aminopeptidase N
MAALADARRVAAGTYGRVAGDERYASMEDGGGGGGGGGGAALRVRALGRGAAGAGSAARKWYGLAGLGSLALAVTLGVTLRGTSVTPAGADDGCSYAGYRLAPAVAPSSYAITWRPAFAPPFVFSGAVAIELAVLLPGQRCLQLHAYELDVANASVVALDGAAGSGGPQPASVLRYDAVNERVVLALGAPYAVGTRLRLSLDFAGALRDDNTGLYRSSYRDDAGAEVHTVATQFEATAARRAWPCFDEPAYKAVFNVTVDGVPPGYTALGNMPVALTAPNPDGTRAVTFAPLVPRMSTYLVALVVAPLVGATGVTTTGVNVTAWGVDRANNSARVTFARDVAIRVLPFYEGLFGIPFPLPKLDMAAIPDFAAGARAPPSVHCVCVRLAPCAPSPTPLLPP